MDAAIVPCGFAIAHMYRNRNYMDAKTTDTIVQTMLFASIVASTGSYLSPALAWCIVAPPVVLYIFFVIYQRLRAKREVSSMVRVG